MEAQQASAPFSGVPAKSEISWGGSPWPARRRRAEQLRDRYPFAAEVLTLYLALLEAQEAAYESALTRVPDAGAVPALAARDVLPRVIEATVAAGPPPLAEAVVGRFHGANLEELISRWIRGGELSTVDTYLARAATAPILEATRGGRVAATGPSRHCPYCGGPPQLSYFAACDDPLVTGPRHLVCARCNGEWVYPRMVCAACGEETSGLLPVYSETDQLPHLRVDGCDTCRRYLIGIDLRRDAMAVPVVDELAALPLDLYATDRGLTKVVPNLMGM